MKLNIRASYDSFRELRENNAYYIDKTDLIEEFLIDKFDKAVLFARPRRFGKTLTMTMLRDFLDIRRDSRDIFDGLKVMNNPELVDKFMNKYPVVFISMKEISGCDFNEIFRNLQIAVANVCDDLSVLRSSDKIDDIKKEFFVSLLRKEGRKEDTIQALGLLCQMLKEHYNKPAFVIIDEYDVPMAKAHEKPEYDQVANSQKRKYLQFDLPAKLSNSFLHPLRPLSLFVLP